MKLLNRIIGFIIIFCLVFEQSGFAQVAPQLSLPAYLRGLPAVADSFRPVQLRALAADPATHGLELLLDKGTVSRPAMIGRTAAGLIKYFKIGLALPNSMFWVNLRPDSEKDIIDPYLERTDVGRILLAADVQLKKDVARFTSPDTKEGREYWNRLYAKAEELFGGEDVEIPTITRPWIVPGEIIIKQTPNGAYIYKAVMKVCLEQDWLGHHNLVGCPKGQPTRLSILNEYSSQLIRELVIPRLTREVNSSKRYSELRQVFYSLILAQWAKKNNCAGCPEGQPAQLFGQADSLDLTGLTSRKPWSKQEYYKAYRASFELGEYDKEERVRAPDGITIRRYFSGGMMLDGGKVSVISSVGTDLVPPVGGGMFVAAAYRDGKIVLNARNDGGAAFAGQKAKAGRGVKKNDVSRKRNLDGGFLDHERSAVIYSGTVLLGTAVVAAALASGIPILAAYVAAHAWFAAVTTICMLGIIAIPAYNVSLVVMNCILGTVPGQSGYEASFADSVLPKVAVQIPTRNEPFDVVKRTILSAMAIDYPAGKLNIQILDDSDEGNSEYIRLKEFYDNDPVIARMKALHGDLAVVIVHRGVNTGYKAGNLNNGSALTDAGYFLILDADSIVPKDICRRIMPRFVTDPKLAFVQTKIKSLNPRSSLYSLGISSADEFLKDYYYPRQKRAGFAFFEGHNGIVSRKALEAAGGWSETEPSEDFDFSMKAAVAGYYGVWDGDIVTFEQTADSFDGLKIQRKRWTSGTISAFLSNFRTVMGSGIPWYIKLDIALHVNQFAMTLPLALIQYGVVTAAAGMLFTGSVFLNPGLGLLSGFSVLAVVAVSAVSFLEKGVRNNGDFMNMAAGFPAALIVQAGLLPLLAEGVLKAILGLEDGFKVTPKEMAGYGGIAETAVKNMYFIGFGLAQFIPLAVCVSLGADISGINVFSWAPGLAAVFIPFLGRIGPALKPITASGRPEDGSAGDRPVIDATPRDGGLEAEYTMMRETAQIALMIAQRIKAGGYDALVMSGDSTILPYKLVQAAWRRISAEPLKIYTMNGHDNFKLYQTGNISDRVETFGRLLGRIEGDIGRAPRRIMYIDTHWDTGGKRDLIDDVNRNSARVGIEYAVFASARDIPLDFIGSRDPGYFKYMSSMAGRISRSLWLKLMSDSDVARDNAEVLSMLSREDAERIRLMEEMVAYLKIENPGFDGGAPIDISGIRPDAAVNALSRSDVSGFVEALERGEAHARFGPDSAEYLNKLSRLAARVSERYSTVYGRRMRIGPVVYYPAGGADVFAFGLDPAITDIVSVGRNRFGLPAETGIPLGVSAALERYYLYGMDSSLALEGVKEALGNVILGRCIAGIGASIQGLYYFDLSQDGSIRFIDPAGLGKPVNSRNAMVEMLDPSGRTLRYWYISRDLNAQDPSFAAFAGRAVFATMLFKAAFNLGDEKSEHFDPGMVREKIFAPALRNKADIITDEAIDTTAAEALPPRPYSLGGSSPEAVELNADREDRMRFGNSRRNVYFGPAEVLIGFDASDKKNGNDSGDGGVSARPDGIVHHRSRGQDNPGGIDLRGIPIVTQPLEGPVGISVQLQRLAAGSKITDLDAAWRQIGEKMRSSVMPYAELKEYIAVCRSRVDGRAGLSRAADCLMEILSIEEANALETNGELLELLSCLG